MDDTLSYYMAQPYKTIFWYEDGDWNAVVWELPGCIANGDTREEVLALIEEAKECWLLDHITHEKTPVPEPQAVPALNR